MSGKSRKREQVRQNDTGPAQSPGKPKAPKAPPPPPPPPEGLYDQLGVQDETKEFSKLASRDRTQDVSGVVLHRTESPTMESTRNSYRTQMKNGNHVGAHYLVGKEGETSLTVPTDKEVAHVRGNKDAAWKGANARTVGIENVGMASKIDKGGDLRKQVSSLSLPPQMRERLLALDDKKLKQTLSDSDYEMHTDITGPQKRSNWNLVKALTQTHGLDMNKDVQPHEGVDHKTLGEGEPIKELLTTMQGWPQKLAALEKRIADLEADPAHDAKKLAEMKETLTDEKANWDAVQRDKTPQENNALEGEKLLGQPGPAQEREQRRVGFYDQLWARKAKLDALTK